MDTGSRSRLQMDERRSQLLELGLRLFGTRPYDEVSIDDIAAAAKISKGLLYHYFGGKREFYVATVRHAADRLTAAVTPDDTIQPPAVRAAAGLGAYLDFVEQHAEAYAALISGGLGADPRVQDIVHQTRSRIVRQMMSHLGLSDPRPVFRIALRSFVGAVEAAALHWLAHRDVGREQVLQLMLGMLQATVLTASSLDPEANVELPTPGA